MALMTLMDNLINYLDNGEYIWICIFRLFNSSLLQSPRMGSVEVHWIGFTFLSLTDISL